MARRPITIGILPAQVRNQIASTRSINDVEAVIFSEESGTPVVNIEFNDDTAMEFRWEGEPGHRAWQLHKQYELELV